MISPAQLEPGCAIKAENLGLTYKQRSLLGRTFEHQALVDISFSIQTGETFGIFGRNGSGKSTLLSLLAGIITPDSGKLVFNHINSRSLLSLGLGFDSDLSGSDNSKLSLMLQGYSMNQAKALIPEIAEFSELGEFFYQPVRTYSAGMRARLGFSVGVKAKTDLLLIDEVLSVGDQHFKAKAEKVMLNKINSQQTVVFVSHSLAQMKNLCTRGIWIDQGRVHAYGAIQDVASAYQDYMKSLG